MDNVIMSPVSISWQAYFAGVLFISVFSVLFFYFEKIDKKIFSSRMAKKIGIFLARFSLWISGLISRFRDVFFVRLIEEGLVEGLFLKGTENFFSNIGRNPLRSLDGNINVYMLVSTAAITALIIFL